VATEKLEDNTNIPLMSHDLNKASTKI